MIWKWLRRTPHMKLSQDHEDPFVRTFEYQLQLTWTPHHKSALTCKKWWEGCGAPQRERSDKHEVTRANYRACHAKSSSCTKSEMTTVSPKKLSGLSRPRPSAPQPAPETTSHVDRCLPTFYNVQTKMAIIAAIAQKTSAAHGKICPSNMSQVLRNFCASQPIKNAHGRLTRELFAQAGANKTSNPQREPWTNPGFTPTLKGPLSEDTLLAWGTKKKQNRKNHISIISMF